MLGRLATERDLNGAYNAAVFFSTKRTGVRTSKNADPPATKDGSAALVETEAVQDPLQ